MECKKPGFEAFIATVDASCVPLVTELHQVFLASGCTLALKEAKSGYVASYLRHKKTVANYVFRKKGLFARIYANHLARYMECLEDLPQGMIEGIKAAPVCRRLVDPEACNSRCAMGYDFILDGVRHQKCRNSAFFIQLCGEYQSAVKLLLQRELAACGA